MTKTAGRGKSVYGRAGGWPRAGTARRSRARRRSPRCPQPRAPRLAPAPTAGRHRARRARGAAQARPRSASPRCARRPLAEAQPARPVGRVLGAEQPPERGAAARADRLRRALERHLRRGPAAQRLAARARPAPRLGQLQRRVPALSHERRPRGHLLLAGHRAARRPRRQGRRRSPPGWRRRTPTTAAPCSPPSLVDAKQLDAAPTSGRRSRLSAEANKAAGRAPGRGACSARPRGGERRRDLRRARPATSARRRRHRGARSMPSSPTLALARLAASDSESAAGMLVDRWEKALPPDLAAWAWASVARQTAMKLQPEAADQFLRAERVNRKGNGARAARRRCSPGRCARRCAPTAASRAGSRWCRRSTRCRRPSRRTRPGSTGRRARLQALAKDSQDGEALHDEQPRAARPASPAQLNFYGQLAAEDLGQPQALPPKPAPLTPAERDAVASHPGLAARPGADRDRPAQRRRARVELLDPRPERPRAAGRGAARLRPRGLGPLHQHQRPHPRRDRHGAALPDAAAQGGLGAGAARSASTRPSSTA